MNPTLVEPARPAFPQAAAVERSLEVFGDRVGDPTARVYETLFARFPQMKVHFWRDSDGAIKGSMLSRTFEAILDFVGERRYADRMIMNEVITHEGYDIPRGVFVTFFEVIRDTMADSLGSDWSSEFEQAWSSLLTEIAAYTGAVPDVPGSNPHFALMLSEWEARGLQSTQPA